MAAPRPDTRTSGSILYDAYGALTRVFGGLWSRYGGWGWSKIRLFLPSSRFDWEREAADTWMNSVVALCLAWLGDRFPRPLVKVSKVTRKGDYQPVGRHAVTDLWQKPNRFYSRRTLEKAVGLSLKVDGNAYIYKVRDNGGKVRELWWVPHFRILPTWPSDGSKYIDGYRVWLDTAIYHLPVEDIIHIRDGIDPRNERLGLAALRACLREVCTVNFESGFTAALMKNSGVPGYAIVPDGENVRPGAGAATEIKEKFVENFGGDRTGEPIVMAGRYKLVELGFSPEKLALDKLPQNAISRIAAAIGVAPMSVGLPDPGKTYSNLAEANRTSWGTVVAIQELVGEALRWQLLPEPIATDAGLTSPGCNPHEYVIEYDYSNIQELQESLDAIATRVRENFKADVIRRNEAREELGYEPDPIAGDLYFGEIQQGATANPAGADPDADGAGAPALAVADDLPGEKTLGVAGQRQLPFSPRSGSGDCGCLGFKGDYSLPPHPAEYPATVAAFELYLDDCEEHEVKGIVVDDLAGWLTKYNHCHGPDGRFCGGRGHGGTGTFTPLAMRPGGPPEPKPAAKPAATPAKKPAAKPAGGGGAAAAPSHEDARDLGWASDAKQKAVFEELNPHWAQSLSPAEKAAIEGYAGEHFETVNRMMRTGHAPADHEAYVQAHQVWQEGKKALAKASLPEDLVVYRGIRDVHAALGLKPGKDLVGVTIKDKAFLSTSLSAISAASFARGPEAAILRIVAPKGSRGASVAGLTSFGSEREILFHPGSKMKITRVSRDEHGRMVLDATLYTPGAKDAADALAVKAVATGAGALAREAAKFGWCAGDVTVEKPSKSWGWSWSY